MIYKRIAPKLRRAPALAALTLLAACALKPPTRVEGPPPNTREDIVLPREQKLLWEAEGWRVFELLDSQHTFCMAIKPVNGTPWPGFSAGTFWPRFSSSRFPNFQIVSGGAGFFMYIVDSVELPYFGFYGKYPHRLPSVAQVDGTTVAAVDNRDTVLSWEGREVAFKVPTQPSEESATVEVASGTLNFTGVEKAYAAMLRCHRERR